MRPPTPTANGNPGDPGEDDPTPFTPPTPPMIALPVCCVPSPAPSPGGTVTYTLTWRNNGGGIAFPAPVVVDATPTNLVVLRAGITNTAFVGAPPPAVGTLLYHRATDAAGVYVTVPPATPSDVDYVALGLPQMNPGQSATIVFDVMIDIIASEVVCASVSTYIDPATGNPTNVAYPKCTTALTPTPPIIEYHFDANFAQIVGSTPMNRALYVQAKAPTLNQDPFSAETGMITLVSNRTGDTETFPAIETGANTGVFQILNGGLFVPTENGIINPITLADGTLQAEPRDVITATISAPVGGTPVTVDTVILIDPAGVVFSSVDGVPVAGATVTLVDVTGGGNGGNPGGPATVFFEGGAPAPNKLVTGSDGAYQFPLVSASTYRLVVEPPAGFTWASVVPPQSLPQSQPVGTPGYDPALADFSIDAAALRIASAAFRISSGGVLRRGLPGQPRHRRGVHRYPRRPAALAQRDPHPRRPPVREVLTLGDSLDYTVTIRNTGPIPVTGVSLVDTLPRGFRYQRGTSRLSTGAALPRPGRGPRPHPDLRHRGPSRPAASST